MISSPLARDAFLTGVLGLIALIVSVGAGWLAFAPQGDYNGPDPRVVAQIKERTIINATRVREENNEIVRYTYLGAELPETLAPDEVVALRKESSWTRQVGTGTQGEARYISIVYPTPQFVRSDDGTWHYLEYDSATLEEFRRGRPDDVNVSFLSPHIAHAAVAQAFSGAGDGQVQSDASTWTTARSATNGSSADYTTAGAQVQSNFICVKSSCGATLKRVFLPFNTSFIPAGSTISAATLNVYVISKTNPDNDGNDYVTVVQTSQASSDSLVTEDFDQCGALNSPTEGINTGERKDITSITTSAYLTFSLNSTGVGWIKKSGQTSNCGSTAGVTCIGLREGHDIVDSQPDADSSIFISTSEESGTAQDPYLSVTYTAQAAFWQFQDY